MKQIILNNIKIAIIFLYLVSIKCFADSYVNAYKALDNQVTIVKAETMNNAPDLPDQLVISPGYYRFNDKYYNLKTGGLYRFYVDGLDSQQRIVNDGDIKKILSSIAWITMHGVSDNSLSFDEMVEIAKKTKLSLTCSVISSFANQILNQQGIESRVVSTMTLDNFNGYDDGHVMIEVFMKGINKWVLYDLDAKCYFTQNNIPLSFLDFYIAAKTGNYKIITISNTVKVDSGSFAKYSFFMDELFSNPKDWYKHVFHVLIISNYYLCDDTIENRRKVENKIPGIVYINSEKFKDVFYRDKP